MDAVTMRRIRWVVAAPVLTAAGAFLAWAILLGVNLHARFKAQSLVVAIRSMQVGSTTLEETRPILARYRASALPASFIGPHSADIGFGISVRHETMEKVGERFYFLRYVGLAPWGAVTEIYFRKGRLCELRSPLGQK